MRLLLGLATIVCLPVLIAVTLLWETHSDQTQAAPLAGAIFTTTPDGGIVNENVRYDLKIEVYLDGGPGPNAPQTAAGLPGGLYVFQVTDPSGKVLLSEDPSKCRVIEVDDGVIVRLVPPSELGLADSYEVGKGRNASAVVCHIQDEPDGVAGPSGRHDTNTDSDHGEDGAIVVQLMPFFDTPNPGSVYKAWMMPLGRYEGNGGDLDAVPQSLKRRGSQIGYQRDEGFGPPRDQVKTDNFKVREFFPPEITVRKFHDENGNGAWDDGEPEIGVDECVDQDGNIVSCGDPDGGGWPYEFTEPVDGGAVNNGNHTPGIHVAGIPGTYEACEGMFPNWGQTAAYRDGEPLGISPCVSVEVEGLSGETHEVIFGNTQLITISGEKFIDFEADGVKDAEDMCPSDTEDPVNHPGCAGVPVCLTGTDNLARTVEECTDTDEDGAYEFTDIYPGAYTVGVEEEADGFFCSFPGLNDCNYDLGDLSSGEVAEDKDFGDFSLTEIHGVKFFDRNGDGDQDGGEEGIADVEIHLDGTQNIDLDDDGSLEVHLVTWTCGGAMVPVCMDEPLGSYWFLDLVPGDYDVTEVIPEGFWQIAPGGDLDHDVTLVSDEICEDKDFANFGPCDGLTPGYWSNWDNHYTEEQFLMLLEGTVAEGDIGLAEFYLSSFGCDGGDALHCMRRFLLANQLTLNLTQRPELPNPDDAGLVGLCSIEGIGTLEDAIDQALDILEQCESECPDRADILDAKNHLAAFAELNG
jgi:hypothetical protein